jgi:ABC-type antimicrobial peptide transport system permease subunit
MIRVRNVSVGFLEMLRVPLLSGRGFTREDATGAPVALVNDVAARKFWGEANPIGESLVIRKISYQIVGVVGSMRYAGPASVLPPEAFLPFEQTARNYAAFLFRGPVTSIPALKAAVWSVNPTQPISVVVADRMFGRATATRRFNMFLMSIFAVLAVAIALTGIYGVISFVVNQRTREVGVRIALGAGRSQVIGLFLRQGLGLLATGIVFGLVAASLLGSTVQSFLFGVEPGNPLVFAIVGTAFAAIGLIAAWIPALRASRIEPLSALKSE